MKQFLVLYVVCDVYILLVFQVHIIRWPNLFIYTYYYHATLISKNINVFIYINIYIYIFLKNTSIYTNIIYPQYVLLALWNKIVFHFIDSIQVCYFCICWFCTLSILHFFNFAWIYLNFLFLVHFSNSTLL